MKAFQDIILHKKVFIFTLLKVAVFYVGMQLLFKVVNTGKEVIDTSKDDDQSAEGYIPRCRMSNLHNMDLL